VKMKLLKFNPKKVKSTTMLKPDNFAGRLFSLLIQALQNKFSAGISLWISENTKNKPRLKRII
jgi:hypothetical protein